MISPIPGWCAARGPSSIRPPMVPTTLTVSFGGKIGRRAGEGRSGGSSAAAQLPARRHAGFHAGRLQHRELPRGGARQGRVPHFAVRIRPRRRPLPPDAGNGRPPDQSRRSPPRARCSKRRPGPSRTPAASGSRPAASSITRSHGWIESGPLNDDPTKLPTVVGVDLYPKQSVLDGKGSTQQLTVRARYSDGTDRDVTSWPCS